MSDDRPSIAELQRMCADDGANHDVDLALCRARTRDMRESSRYAAIVREQRVSAMARDIRSTYYTDSRKP